MACEQGLDVDGIPSAVMRVVYDSGFVLGRGSAADFWALLRERTGLDGDDNAENVTKARAADLQAILYVNRGRFTAEMDV